MTKLGDMYRRVHGLVSERPTNFGWVFDDKLAGSGQPVTKSEFDWAVSQGIKSIVTVMEVPLPTEWTSMFDYMHLRVEDFNAPTPEEIDQAVEFINRQISEGKPVMVHCAAGKGRTGVVLAGYLIKMQGLSSQQSIEKIRDMRPGSVQSEAQEWALTMYEKYLNNKK